MADPIKGKIEISQLSNTSTRNGADYYQKLIVDNLTFIEKQCGKACTIYKRKISSSFPLTKDSPEIETQSLQVFYTDEIDHGSLVNDVIDRLKADSYKVLREFRGHSTLTTYLGTIISHLVIDLIRVQKGRNRARDRARAKGPIGEKLYELVIEKGFPSEEAYAYLKENCHVKDPPEEIETMIDWIRGPGPRPMPVDPTENQGLVTVNNPEKELAKKEKDELTKRALNQTLSELSDEENFIVRMRFPLSEDEDPKDLSEMAGILGISEKAVDSRIRRILTKCKEKMLGSGLGVIDLIDA